MSINYSAILPHGFNLIEDIYPNQGEDWQNLTKALKNVSSEIFSMNPDVIVIASPHNLRIEGQIGIITSEWLEGMWWNEKQSENVHLKIKCDRTFGKQIYERLKEDNIPAVSVNYGAAEGDLSAMKMDWGTLIPLWYISKKYAEENKEIPPVVLITPSREIPWENLVRLGTALNGLATKDGKEVVFIASCDHGHAHDPKGPYGFHPASAVYDKQICDMIKENHIEKLLELSEEFIDHAKPDSFWQMLILLGILNVTNLKNDLCVYECPEYYGMIVASFK